ncbi:hypothetical protein ACOSP7_008847 [Xanthoceras sorbifolium]
MPFIVVHILFINQNTATAIGNNDEVSLIRKSCIGTDFPDTCISVLEADPRSTAAANLKNLTRVSMDININDCIEKFSASSYHVKEYGIPYFENGDYEGANEEVSYCTNAASSCKDTGIKFFSKEIEIFYDFSADLLQFLRMLFI